MNVYVNVTLIHRIPTEAEEASDEFQDLEGDEDTYGPDQVDDTLIGI